MKYDYPSISSPDFLHDASLLSSSLVDCSFVPTILPEETEPDTSMRLNVAYSKSFESIRLNREYSIAYNFISPLRVLNDDAYQFASLFQQKRAFRDIPQVWFDKYGENVINRAFAQLSEAKLFRIHHKKSPKPHEIPIVLTSWLHLTDRCNLRCTYCYLAHEKVDMTEAVGISSIEATFRSAKIHHYRKVCLKYAGGEASLKLDLVLKLHMHATKLAKQADLELEGVLLTNGTRMSLENILKIKDAGLKVTVSLDGLKETHDSQRPFAGGKGSFEQVVEGIKLLLQEGILPNIAITVSGRNISGLPEFISWILDLDLPFYINFYRENKYSSTHSDLKLDEIRIIEGMQRVFEVIENKLPERSLMSSLVDRADLTQARIRSCGVGHSYMVFDHLGRVSKCQMQMDSPVISAQSPDPLAHIREEKRGIQNMSVNEKEGCRDCKWKHWCSGGCPNLTYKATGRYDVQSPNCHIYKSLFPEVLRLEGLRVLKYGIKDRQILLFRK